MNELGRAFWRQWKFSMLNPEKDPHVNFGHMLSLSRKAVSFIEGKTRADYLNDESLQYALIHLIQTVGEAARDIPNEIKVKYPEIPWKVIIGMRHKIVHDYLGVDIEVVWSTVNNDLPGLIEHLQNIVGDE